MGIYGGTFNPIHTGHLRAAEEVAETLALDRVVFLPSNTPPHKRGAAGGEIASGAARLEWVRRAVRDHPRFEASSLEIDRGGTSYTAETLRAWRDQLGLAPPIFILGCDALVEMGSWRDLPSLVSLSHYAVMNRPPGLASDLGAWLPEEARDYVEITEGGRAARHRRAGTWMRLVPIRGLAISSSTIRQLLRARRSVRYLVPEAARADIERCPVYRAGGPPRPPDSTSRSASDAAPGAGSRATPGASPPICRGVAAPAADTGDGEGP